MNTYHSTNTVKAGIIVAIQGCAITVQGGDPIIMTDAWITHHTPIRLGDYLVSGRPGVFDTMNSASFNGRFEQIETPPDDTGATLEAAISLLEHDNDDHWTQGGLPSMAFIEACMSDASITRAAVEAAAPGLVRRVEGTI